MKTIDSQGVSYLLFPDKPDIVHRWKTVGLILVPETRNPKTLNLFRVFISANSKAKVEKFVNYQIRQGRRKEKSIQVRVEKLESPHADASPQSPREPLPSLEEIMQQFQKVEKTHPDFLYRAGEINVGIDRLYMTTQPPYRISYTIDPLFAFLRLNEKYTFEFTADKPFISLESHQGNVRLQVFEGGFFREPIDTGFIDVAAGTSQVFPAVERRITGMWQASVTGMNLDNAFTLDYARVIT